MKFKLTVTDGRQIQVYKLHDIFYGLNWCFNVYCIKIIT